MDIASRAPGLRLVACLCLAINACSISTPARTATIVIAPSDANDDCNEEFENLANALAPGDELVLQGGVYTQSCQRMITVQGTADAPIVIRAADGQIPVLTRPADNQETTNNIEIRDSRHLIIRGLHFSGGNIGVHFRGTTSDVVFEGNTIHGTGNNALAANNGDSTRCLTGLWVFYRTLRVREQ